MSDLHGLSATGETTDSLEGVAGGIWLVTTQGSQHLWDLDAGTYMRIPGEQSPGSFAYDHQAHRITRVERWPAVGDYSVVYYDDPVDPHRVEQWRSSSQIRRIERLAPTSGQQPSAGDNPC